MSIKFGIKLLALDFINREEYNAYKHGLNISFLLQRQSCWPTNEWKLKYNGIYLIQCHFILNRNL